MSSVLFSLAKIFNTAGFDWQWEVSLTDTLISNKCCY